MTQEVKIGLERHIGTGLSVILVALVVWVGTTVTGNRERLAAVAVEIANIKEDVKEIEITLSDRADAIETARQNLRKLQELESRIRELESPRRER